MPVFISSSRPTGESGPNTLVEDVPDSKCAQGCECAVKAEEQLARGPKLPEPPKHLSPAMRRFFSEIVRSWDLETHHLRLLSLLCEAFDRCEQARVQIEKEGLTVPGRFGPRTHPACAIERDSRLAAARLLRELDLDQEMPAERRPPALKRYN